MEKYYNVQVSLKEEDDKGKIKKVTENYLVKDTGCTEAEAAVVKMFTNEGSNLDYEVKSVKATNILKVL